MTRPDEWARVDYRSRAVAIICTIATTLVAAVTLTAYVATQVGFAEGALLPTPPREAAFVAQQCPPRYVHQIFVPRTVNGTGHTGPSEFCATSI